MKLEYLDVEYEINGEFTITSENGEGPLKIELPASGIVELRITHDNGVSEEVSCWIEGMAKLKLYAFRGYRFLLPRTEINFDFEEEARFKYGLKNGRLIDSRLSIIKKLEVWISENIDMN